MRSSAILVISVFASLTSAARADIPTCVLQSTGRGGQVNVSFDHGKGKITMTDKVFGSSGKTSLTAAEVIQAARALRAMVDDGECIDGESRFVCVSEGSVLTIKESDEKRKFKASTSLTVESAESASQLIADLRLNQICSYAW